MTKALEELRRRLEPHLSAEDGLDALASLVGLIAELEAERDAADKHAEIAQRSARKSAAKVEVLEAAQIPRPMSEAPRDGTWVGVYQEPVPYKWNHEFDKWEDEDGSYVSDELFLGERYIPCHQIRR